MITVYLSPFEFEKELQRELELKKIKILSIRERLIVTEGPAQKIAWAQQVWQNCVLQKFSSIKEGQEVLKSQGRDFLWSLYSVGLHRRAALIEEGVKVARVPLIIFGQGVPSKKYASWTLLNEKEILFSTEVWPALPLGELRFEENKEGPPSRAYLKLWESFTRLGLYPKKGETCLDIGSSPGGWTWVLAELQGKVISVDKAPLDPKVAAYKNVKFLEKSAFSLSPEELGPLDWFCSDVICYPEKLFKFVQKWWELKERPQFVCTLKFQGETDFKALADFAGLPGSQLIHLFHNKHELTWIWHKP